MIKAFKDLMNLDISSSTEQKPNFVWDKKENKMKQQGSFTYLNWAKAIMLLYENGADDVNYKPLKNESGHSLFMNPSLLADGLSGCPEVRVWVKVDDKEGEFSYPIARGASVVAKDKMTQLDIHVCQQRALVKGIAILTGLGLKLWSKEDFDKEPEMEEEIPADRQINKIEAEAITALSERKGVPIKQICEKMHVVEIGLLMFSEFVAAKELLETMPDKKHKDLGL